MPEISSPLAYTPFILHTVVFKVDKWQLEVISMTSNVFAPTCSF